MLKFCTDLSYQFFTTLSISLKIFTLLSILVIRIDKLYASCKIMKCFYNTYLLGNSMNDSGAKLILMITLYSKLIKNCKNLLHS